MDEKEKPLEKTLKIKSLENEEHTDLERIRNLIREDAISTVEKKYSLKRLFRRRRC